MLVSGRTGTPHDRLKFVFAVIPLRHRRELMAARYLAQRAPSIRDYAPYTAHVLEIELLFRFAQERGLISRDRASNRVDIAYLNYLPFCNVFVSTDRLHAATAPLFMREGQAFVKGAEMKADLRKNKRSQPASAAGGAREGHHAFCAEAPVGGHLPHIPAT